MCLAAFWWEVSKSTWPNGAMSQRRGPQEWKPGKCSVTPENIVNKQQPNSKILTTLKRKCGYPSHLHNSSQSHQTAIIWLSGSVSSSASTDCSAPNSPQFMTRFCKTPSRFHLDAQVHMHLLWMLQMQHKSQNPESTFTASVLHTEAWGNSPRIAKLPCFCAGLHYLLAVLMQDHCPPDSWSPGQPRGSRILMSMGSGKAPTSLESGVQQMEAAFPDTAGAVWVIPVGLALFKAHFPGHLNTFLGWGTFCYADGILLAGRTWIPRLGSSLWWWQHCLKSVSREVEIRGPWHPDKVSTCCRRVLRSQQSRKSKGKKCSVGPLTSNKCHWWSCLYLSVLVSVSHHPMLIRY